MFLIKQFKCGWASSVDAYYTQHVNMHVDVNFGGEEGNFTDSITI